MKNYYEEIRDVMKEKNVSIKDLENNNIFSKNVFYTYTKYNPSISVIVRLANFLEVSIDYLLGRTDTNKFKRYKEKQENFYNNLIKVLKEYNLSFYRVCKDLNISDSNLGRWRYGTKPKLEMLISIADYLQCSIDDLLDLE